METTILLLAIAFVATTLFLFIKRRNVKKVQNKIPSFREEDLRPNSKDSSEEDKEEK